MYIAFGLIEISSVTTYGYFVEWWTRHGWRRQPFQWPAHNVLSTFECLWIIFVLIFIFSSPVLYINYLINLNELIPLPDFRYQLPESRMQLPEIRPQIMTLITFSKFIKVDMPLLTKKRKIDLLRGEKLEFFIKRYVIVFVATISQPIVTVWAGP